MKKEKKTKTEVKASKKIASDKEKPSMKKKVKESGPDRIQKAKENLSKVKSVRDLCEKIVDAFECPGLDGTVEGPEISELVNELTPWQSISPDNMKKERDEGFSRLWEAIKVSFAIGYVVGQALDVPEIDTAPILDFLREKKSILYLPHKKAA